MTVSKPLPLSIFMIDSKRFEISVELDIFRPVD